jgi:fatty-acyl-CoA synthase
VIGVRHPKWDERPLLIVQLKPVVAVEGRDILAFMQGKIAGWWMPDDVVIVDSIPTLPPGKSRKPSCANASRIIRSTQT